MDKIKSATGKRMLRSVSPIYDNSLFMQMFYQGVGSQFDRARSYFQTLREQAFTQTVTWAIECQERKYSIEPDESLTLEQRRARLKIKLQSRRPINPAILEKYARENYGVEIYLDEQQNPGCITITLQDYERTLDFLHWLDREKPAHLLIYCKLYRLFNVPMYVGMGRLQRGRCRIAKLDSVQVQEKKVIDELNGRQMIIEPTKVTIIRGDDTTIIPIEELPSDELKLRLAFPTKTRTVTLQNPRADLEPFMVDTVSEFAADHELFIDSSGETTNGIDVAKVISISEEELDLDLAREVLEWKAQ